MYILSPIVIRDLQKAMANNEGTNTTTNSTEEKLTCHDYVKNNQATEVYWSGHGEI